jgi:hypothetical protein
MGAPFDQDDFEFADWHRAYHAAVLETDRVKVLRLVQAAEDAISKRLDETSQTSGHEAEGEAMRDALGTLGFLKIEAHKPNWSRNLGGTK